MDSTEYLESVVGDSYRREGDQEENVARSLPFFAAALALLVTLIGLVRNDLPLVDSSAFSIVTYGCLCLASLLILLGLACLLAAVWPRRFAYIASEDLLVKYADELRAYYGHAGATAEEIEKAVVADLRQTLTDQYARGAIRNRSNNAARLRARGFAATFLVAALAVAFVLVVAIMIGALKI